MSDSVLMPKVVDQDGHPVAGPDLEAVLRLVSGMAQVGQLARIRLALERRQFTGRVVEKELSCTEEHQALALLEEEPFASWKTVVFFNDGPNDAYISINEGSAPFTVKRGESHPIDLTDADHPLHTIYYWCSSGNTATVRAQGKY